RLKLAEAKYSVLVEFLEHDHGPLVRHATYELLHERIHARVGIRRVVRRRRRDAKRRSARSLPAGIGHGTIHQVTTALFGNFYRLESNALICVEEGTGDTAFITHHLAEGEDMTGRIAVITGANRGLGRSMALHVARSGVDVLGTYRSHADEAAELVREIEALGRRSTFLQLDVGRTETFPAFVDALGQTLEARFGRTRFDYLVNNAG